MNVTGTMETKPAVTYLLRKVAAKKKRFVIQRKIVLAALATFAAYLAARSFGPSVYVTLSRIEPIVYGGIFGLAYTMKRMWQERMLSALPRVTKGAQL